MDEPINVKAILNGLIEELAAIEHERWSHWQRYMHSRGVRQADGSLVLPAHLIERWERQAGTEYSSLSDVERESDIEQVKKYLPVIVTAFERI